MNRAETHLECAGRAIAATALSSGGRCENLLSLRACESGVAAPLCHRSPYGGGASMIVGQNRDAVI